MATTVLIVDDHPSFLAGARALLDLEGYEVIGTATGGREALEAAAALRPQLVVLDVGLPDIDGFAVAELLAAAPSPPAVVLISARTGADADPRLSSSPARGLIAKRDLTPARLAALIG